MPDSARDCAGTGSAKLTRRLRLPSTTRWVYFKKKAGRNVIMLLITGNWIFRGSYPEGI
jgi:hypothetical protein